jgi:3-oxoacyl-[acyl-carrier protein] reductase
MIQFDEQVVLVTGGSRGIGRAIAETFAGAGARVAINYRQDKAAADETVESVQSTGQQVRAYQADIISHSQVDMLISRILNDFGQLNAVVNNAGIWTYGPIHHMDPQTWHETLAVNLTGTYNVCKAAIPHLNGERGDAIVNISSTAGQRGEAQHSHYAATKGGVIALTKSLSSELAPRGIRVNCVAPGWVKSDMTQSVMQGDGESQLAADIPLGRVGVPEDIANAVAFLASPLAGFITGEILNVNGGSVLCG